MLTIGIDPHKQTHTGVAVDPLGVQIAQRAVAAAASAMRADEARLREAVQIARGRGHSWNRIAVVLGVSRQAARQRYAEKTTA